MEILAISLISCSYKEHSPSFQSFKKIMLPTYFGFFYLTVTVVNVIIYFKKILVLLDTPNRTKNLSTYICAMYSLTR